MPEVFHILLIDEQNTFLKVYESAQEKGKIPAHWQILWEDNARNVLSSIPKEDEIQCLLFDVKLSGIEIEKMVEATKRHFYPYEVAIILLGELGDEPHFLRGMQAGANACMYKKALDEDWLIFTIQNAYNQVEQQDNYRAQLQFLVEANHELEQYRSFLESQLTDRTAELSDIYEQLLNELSTRKKLEEELNNSIKELDTFVYRASHDLRGPIASLIGLTNLAKVEVTEPNAHKYLTMIGDNSAKLNKILTTLLEVTKIKYIDMEVGAVNFYELTNKIRYHYMKDFMRENIEFKININAQDDFYSDKNLIMNIIQNLIENSIQYSKKGDGGKISLSVISKNDEIYIAISDNGQGIDKSVQPKIFSMFFKHNPSGKGAGIGLYVVKNCVDKLKGHISFTSENGKGTEFNIILPNLKS